MFFLTHSQLVPQDKDSSADIYDARIDGGFPETAPVEPCLGDTCLSPPAAPNDRTPATSSLPDPDSPVPLLEAPPRTRAKPKTKKCARGEVRRNGRCVKHQGGKGRPRSGQARPWRFKAGAPGRQPRPVGRPGGGSAVSLQG